MGGCACRGPPYARLPKSRQPCWPNSAVGCGTASTQQLQPAAPRLGGRLGGILLHSHALTRNSGLCLAVGCRRCSGMASCFNSSGPAQTYVMGRVWACSHALLAAVPFPLDPLQPAFCSWDRLGDPWEAGCLPWSDVGSS